MRTSMSLLFTALVFISTVLPGQQRVANQTATSAGKVTLVLNNVTVADALLAVTKQAGLSLVWDRTSLPLSSRTNVNLQNTGVSYAIRSILNGSGAIAEIGQDGETIIVKRLASAKLRTAQGVISGKVTDSKTGKPVSGATVSVGSDTRGVATREDGIYLLGGVATGTHTITVRLVGYAKQSRSVTVGDGASITADFRLEPSANVLDQIIVTGTVVATELKAVPSAITVITAKQLEERGVTRIDQLFRGDIPGLFALDVGAGPPNGTLNGSLNEVVMFSRGATFASTSSNLNSGSAPIKTYVDGVELADPQYLSQIDPKSIDRIEILTGPQASTIYGSNAINGVMQIFTKRGSTSRPNVSLSFSEGWAQNNFSSALSPSHRYDGLISGTEGKLSYSAGSGWDYTGAWVPGNQLQRVSAYGSTNYQSQKLSVDLNGRQGWTRNYVRGSTSTVRVALAQQGKIVFSDNTSGRTTPSKRSLNGRTLGATIGFTPFSAWSHQITIGTDASDVENHGVIPAYFNLADTSISSSQTFNTRTSQSYSSTLRLPLLSFANATITYGGDHWRTRSSSAGWTRTIVGTITNPSITRNKPDKNSGAYLQGQFGLWDALFFTYGVRADWSPRYGEQAKVRPGRYGVSYAREFGAVSAKLRGSYGRSVRPPEDGRVQGSATSDAGYLAVYGTPGTPLYLTLPNPELGPEFQQGGEGGVELYLSNRASFVVTRYNQTVDGLVSIVSGADSVRAHEPGVPSPTISGCSTTANLRPDGYCYVFQSQNVNMGSIRNQGWELQGSVNAGPFTTRGTYSWTKSRVTGVTSAYRGRVINSSAFRAGQTPVFLPEHTWAMTVSYALKGTSASLNFNGMGNSLSRATLGELGKETTSLRFPANDSPTFISLNNVILPRPGYVTAGLNASQRFTNRVDASLQVTNLTNHYKNDNWYYYPSIGRSSRVGLRIRW